MSSYHPPPRKRSAHPRYRGKFLFSIRFDFLFFFPFNRYAFRHVGNEIGVGAIPAKLHGNVERKIVRAHRIRTGVVLVVSERWHMVERRQKIDKIVFRPVTYRRIRVNTCQVAFVFVIDTRGHDEQDGTLGGDLVAPRLIDSINLRFSIEKKNYLTTAPPNGINCYIIVLKPHPLPPPA